MTRNSKPILLVEDDSVDAMMVKPVDYKKFPELIRAIDLYWTLSELPDGG